jgi:hypothetical protein
VISGSEILVQKNGIKIREKNSEKCPVWERGVCHFGRLFSPQNPPLKNIPLFQGFNKHITGI